MQDPAQTCINTYLKLATRTLTLYYTVDLFLVRTVTAGGSLVSQKSVTTTAQRERERDAGGVTQIGDYLLSVGRK